MSGFKDCKANQYALTYVHSVIDTKPNNFCLVPTFCSTMAAPPNKDDDMKGFAEFLANMNSDYAKSGFDNAKAAAFLKKFEEGYGATPEEKKAAEKATAKLVKALEKLEQTEKMKAIVVNAKKQRYSCHNSPLMAPKLQLISDLNAEGSDHSALIERISDGEFDDDEYIE